MKKVIEAIDKLVGELHIASPISGYEESTRNREEAIDVDANNIKNMEILLIQVLILAKKEYRLWEKVYCDK